MRSSNILIFLLAVFFLNACNSGEKPADIKTIDFKSFSVVHKQYKDFLGSGEIKRAVKLETNENALIGGVDSVVIDKNGDILVGDFDSNKKVFRFDKDGRFITRYGMTGRGPGENIELTDFKVISDGSIILLTPFKLIKFGKSGQLEKEVKINYFAEEIAVIDDLIYLSVINYRSAPKTRKSILILDSQFNEVGGLEPYDERLDKYRFLPLNRLATRGSKLCFFDYYDLNLKVYDPESKEITRLLIPNDNASLDAVWGKNGLRETDMTEIKKRLHNFGLIYGFKNGLLLFERWKEKKIFDYWFLSLEKKKVVTFAYSREFLDNNLFFNRVSGSYEDGIIGVFDDDVKFNKYKKDFPALKEIEMSVEDNPILVFFQFNPIQ